VEDVGFDRFRCRGSYDQGVPEAASSAAHRPSVR
jgi:hypothetical protein